VTSADLLRTWAARLAGTSVVDAGDRDATANANIEVFSIADAQDARVEPVALADFLRDAHRAFSRAAARARLAGWFYAWHDAQAGQLRMSACRIASADELPFRRAITIVEDPLVLAEDVLASTYAHGIPWSELVPVAPGDEPPTPPPYPFPVYARPLVRSV
jgi:hypothetical protein